MNRLRSIIPTLIQINIVVALLSVVFVVIIREQQAQMTAYTQQSFNQSRAVPRKIKEKLVDYQETIQENHEKIHNYEQQLQGLQAELKEYKTQNGLLMQVNRFQQPHNTLVASVKEQQTTDLVKKPKVQNSLPLNSVESRRQSLQRAASTNSQPQSRTSAKPPTVSPSSSSQPKKTVNPIQSIQIDNFPFLAISLPALETAQLSNTVTPDNIPTEAQKSEMGYWFPIELGNLLSPETNEENENQQNGNNNINQIAQNPEPQELSINSLEEVTTKPFNSDKIPSLNYKNPKDSIYYANNIAYGLAIAVDEKQINHGTKMYKKVQTAIKLLRKGASKEEATRKANVPPPVMNQLIKWGEKRPASLLNATKQEQK